MLNKETINELQAIVASNTQDLSLLVEHNAIVLPDSASVKSLESLQETPNHFVAEFSTHSIEEFSDYFCKNKKDNDSIIFIDRDNMRATGILDYGTPEKPLWGKHKTHIKLIKTPAFDALLKNNNIKLDQQETIDFASDWQDYIQFYDINDENIDFFQAINKIRRITVKSTQETESSIGNFNTEASTLESVEITSDNDTPPAGFFLKTPPHEGFDNQLFKCELRAITNGTKVNLKYRVNRLSILIDQFCNDFKDQLQTSATDCSIYIGKVNHR